LQGLEEIPDWLSDTWGISLEASQVILSITVIMAVLLPIFYMTRGRGVIFPLITFFLVEALLVGIGWLSAWVMVGTVCIMALAIATIGSDAVTGRG